VKDAENSASPFKHSETEVELSIKGHCAHP